jgi:UDP-glucose 4-epimerase
MSLIPARSIQRFFSFSDFPKLKVLVTGGAGFIGRHLVRSFQDKAEVCVIDNLRSGHERNLEGLTCHLAVGSILDRDLVRKTMLGVDYVFHLAALVSVPESGQKPDECAEINAAGTLLVLEEAARAGVKKLVFSSSAAIYGDNPVIPKIETMPPEPKSPYAATKLEGERHCQRFTDESRLPTVSLRYFNVFGPHQDPKSQYAAAVPAFIERAIRNQPIVIYGDGAQTRDFIYVDNVVAANAFFATQTDATGVFNVACGRRTTISDLATTICRLTNSSSEITHAPERPGDVRHSVAGVDKIRSTGFAPGCDFSEGLRATIEFFQKKAGKDALR